MREKGSGLDGWEGRVREKRGGRAGWMVEWDDKERKVMLGREEVSGLDGWESGVREREGGRAGLMGELGEEERRRQGWMDGGMG